MAGAFWSDATLGKRRKGKDVTAVFFPSYFYFFLFLMEIMKGFYYEKSFVNKLAFGLVSTLILSACGAETSSSS